MISSMDDLFNELLGFPRYAEKEKKTEEDSLDLLNDFFKDVLKRAAEKKAAEKKEAEKKEETSKEDLKARVVKSGNRQNTITCSNDTAITIRSVTSEIDELKKQLSTISGSIAELKDSLKTDSYREEALQKQVKALAKEMKDMKETIGSLNACSDCDADMLADLYEKIYEVAEACENENIGSFDFLHTDELEGFDDDYDDEEISDSELNELTTSIYDCEEDEDDYSYEEKIKEYVKNSYGFDSFTISDGKEAAIVIPLSDKFNMSNYIVNNITVKEED